MQKQHFIFLLKGKVVTPQSLEDPDAGEIIRVLLLQRFYLSRIHIQAKNNHDALEKFQQITETYPAEISMDVIAC
jgi:hypothetical protein